MVSKKLWGNYITDSLCWGNDLDIQVSSFIFVRTRWIQLYGCGICPEVTFEFLIFSILQCNMY